MSDPTLDPADSALAYPRVNAPASQTRSASAGWMAPVALVLALLAAAAAGWSLLKPAPAPPGVFAANPAAADPKADACKAALLVIEGVSVQSRANLGPEPVALETVAANTRLAMAGGAAYLREATPSNTPAELAEPITALASQLQDVAQHFFVGQTSALPEQSDRLNAAAGTSDKIVKLCK